MLTWTSCAWEDYLYWQTTGKQMLKRINRLIQEIQRQPFTGIGDPEPLKHHLAGCWSRRIDLQHRLVYQVQDGALIILQCRYHY